MPGDCSPSRRVVSKILTVSIVAARFARGFGRGVRVRGGIRGAGEGSGGLNPGANEKPPRPEGTRRRPRAPGVLAPT
jgi:hypothetical protein